MRKMTQRVKMSAKRIFPSTPFPWFPPYKIHSFLWRERKLHTSTTKTRERLLVGFFLIGSSSTDHPFSASSFDGGKEQIYSEPAVCGHDCDVIQDCNITGLLSLFVWLTLSTVSLTSNTPWRKQNVPRECSLPPQPS